MSTHIHIYTGWRRTTGCLKMQVIFCKRATNYRALLQKMTYIDKVSYESWPPCTHLVLKCTRLHVLISCIHLYVYMCVYRCNDAIKRMAARRTKRVYLTPRSVDWQAYPSHIYMYICTCIHIYIHMQVQIFYETNGYVTIQSLSLSLPHTCSLYIYALSLSLTHVLSLYIYIYVHMQAQKFYEKNGYATDETCPSLLDSTCCFRIMGRDVCEWGGERARVDSHSRAHALFL